MKIHEAVITLIISWCALSWALQVSAVTPFAIPYRYRNSQDGTEYYGDKSFPYGYQADEECGSTPPHHDPDGHTFAHGHSTEKFPFTIPYGDTVDDTKSNYAWDAYYIGYTRASTSTFLAVCWNLGCQVPNAVIPIGVDAWKQWTAPSTQCEPTYSGKVKSFQVADHEHCVVISGTADPYETGCYITDTSEKCQSGGVYTYNYGEGTSTEYDVRRRK
jgi:hypothetical protein